ncbi:unnamed protein product [Prorocentrum cordatum]|uniref:Uncharacterized protein n=1 Tax=Prorocentrum cordatum TaxID=2364126 RepID=A0ABN9PNS9_9DINO|nr:unnamed protein product [Polarella glacialis]
MPPATACAPRPLDAPIPTAPERSEVGRCGPGLHRDGVLATSWAVSVLRLRFAAEVGALVAGFRRALAALVAAGFCASASLDVDEVAADLFSEGASRTLVMSGLIEGDPLVDAQILLSEESSAPTTPDACCAALDAWLSRGSGSGATVSLDRVARWRAT